MLPPFELKFGRTIPPTTLVEATCSTFLAPINSSAFLNSPFAILNRFASNDLNGNGPQVAGLHPC